MDEAEYKSAIRMIDKIYNELYKSKEVLRGNKNINNKFENIKAYLDRLEKIHIQIKNNPKYMERLKQYYFYKYIIKPEYLKGYDIKKYEQIIQDQCISLNRWLDFYFSSASDDIPMWAKFWSFQGMLKLGTFKKDSYTFNKRGKNNTCVFADLNIEALYLSINLLKKHLTNDQIDNNLLELVISGSFKKIYEYALKTLFLKRDFNYDGIWKKYDVGSNPIPLITSLQGYNTDWCIAGFATAYKQLSEGDLYIYYTKDKNSEYKVPRLCIRMFNDNIIREICGIASKQNIETGFEEIVLNKINNFPDKSEFMYGLKQLQTLTFIYKKFKSDQELSKEDLIFLYEINSNIIGVVPHQDPRINEILNTRNKRYDLSIIFNCREDEIALTVEELLCNPNNIKCLYDNLTVYEDKINFPKLQFIKGDIKCPYIKDVSGFSNLIQVGGSIYLDSLKDATGFYNLRRIGGSINCEILQNSSGFNNLISIGGSAYYPELGEVLNFNNLKVIGLNALYPKYVDAYFPYVVSGKGLENLEIIKGNMIFYKLKSLEDFLSLKQIRGEAHLSNLKSISNLDKISINSCGGKLFLNKYIQEEYNKLFVESNKRIK